MTVEMSWADANARRCARHGLTAPLTGAVPADVVSVMCGAHSQIAAAGEVSVALRLAGATRSDVQRALWDEHALVRTFGPRGTVHLLAADQLAAWTGALSSLPTGPDPNPDEVRYSPEQTDQLVAAIEVALADAELTADELTQVLVDTVGAWAAEPATEAFQQRIPRWRVLTHTAAYRGALCHGPMRGRRVTYTNPARWLPGFTPSPPDEAWANIVTRYLHAYGPATPGQFARWLAAPVGWARERFVALGDRLEEVRLDGTAACVVAGDNDVAGPPAPGVRLLPYFDAFAVGSHPRERLFPGRAAERALSGGQAGTYPVLLVDGVVGGVWHQRRAGRVLHVRVEPLGRLPADRRRELDEQVERLATIQDARPELTIGDITVGAHA